MTRVLIEDNEWKSMKELLNNKGIWLIKIRNPLTPKSSVFFYRDYHPAHADFQPDSILEKVVAMVKTPELMEPDLAEIEILSKERKKYILRDYESYGGEGDDEGGPTVPVAIVRLYSFGVQENRPVIHDQSFLLLAKGESGKT